MRPKTIVLFVVAVGCGLVASIGVSQYMQQASDGSPTVETGTIFVAVTDIGIGEKLDAQNVKLEEWPRERIPEGAITELSELEDRYPRQRLYVGEPILTAKLMDGNRGSEAVKIPRGYRVVSVSVSAESSVSGMIQPGDRVDLLVFLRKSAEIPETGTRTILKDVNIFSVDGETERRTDEEGQTFQVRTVSLLVKPEQAESIKLASELGRLSLSLRRPDDTTEQSSAGETIQSLLGSAPEDTDDRPSDSDETPPESENGGFVSWLADQATQAPALPQPVDLLANTDDPVEEEPAWTMQILNPTGYREFRWKDVDELPEEVTLDNGDIASEPDPTQQILPPVISDPNSPMPLDDAIGGGGGEEDLEGAL